MRTWNLRGVGRARSAPGPAARAGAAGMIFSLLLVACAGGAVEAPEGGANTTAGVETTAAANPESGEESTLVVGVAADMEGLDGNALSDRPGRFIRANSFATLLKRDVAAALGPNVLTEWEYDQPNFTWTLTMRDDITFHNGEHATSADLKATFDRYSNPDDPEILDDWWNIEETTIVDEYTVQVRMLADNPLVLLRGDNFYLLPKSWIDEIGPGIYAGTEPPPGAGPYRMLEWRQDDQIIMEAFNDFWGGRPPIDNLIFRVVPDDASRVAGLRAGELDVVYPVPPALAESLTDPNLEIRQVQSTLRTRILMDTRQPPFDDIRVREAVNLAIDPQVIVDELLPGALRVPGMLVSNDVGYDPDLPFYEHDPARARELLAEAGYPDGLGSMEFSVNDENLRSGDEPLALVDQLGQVGIQLEPRVQPAGDFDNRILEELNNPDSMGSIFLDGHYSGQTRHAAFTMSDIQPCGPDGVSTHEEHWYYCNTEVADLVAEAISLWATDEERSTEMFAEANRLLRDDHWSAPLWNPFDNFGVKANLNWDADLQMYMADASWDE